VSELQPGKDYRAFLAQGRFMIQRNPRTHRYVFYPRIADPGTGDELEWVQASGEGTVYATTVIHPKPPLASYNVALIDLKEGPRMMSRVESIPPADVAIGMRVTARIVEENGSPLVVFIPL
jgi:uncharacterized OB-fold protein